MHLKPWMRPRRLPGESLASGLPEISLSKFFRQGCPYGFSQSHASLGCISRYPKAQTALGTFDSAPDVHGRLTEPFASAGCERYWTHASSILSRSWQLYRDLKRRHIISRSIRLPGSALHSSMCVSRARAFHVKSIMMPTHPHVYKSVHILLCSICQHVDKRSCASIRASSHRQAHHSRCQQNSRHALKIPV